MPFGVEKRVSAAFKHVAESLGLKVKNRARQQAEAQAQAVFKQEGVAFTREAYEEALAKGGFAEAAGLPDKAAIESFLKQVEGERMEASAQVTKDMLRTLHLDQGTVVENPYPIGHPRRGGIKPASEPPAIKPVVSEAEQAEAMGKLASERPTSAVLPEDGTLHPTAYAMVYKPNDPVSLNYIRQMSDVGREEGFRVVATSHPDDATRLAKGLVPRQRENVSIVQQPGRGNVWIEDFMSVTEKGEVIVPPRVSDQALASQQTRRAEAGLPEGAFGQQGVVSQSGVSATGVGLGVAGERKVMQARTYLEDGNFIPGTLADGTPYGIVGKDSVRISRDHLRQTTGNPNFTDADALRAIAEDYGLQPEHLFAVEQPAEFHLDMRMLAVGPKEVVLNDSVQAAEVQAQWWLDDYARAQPKAPPKGVSREELKAYQEAFGTWRREAQPLQEAIEALREQAKKAAAIEEKTAADLTQQGFKVHRIPGEFAAAPQSWSTSHPYTGLMNFFNGEQGVNAQGQKFFTTMGADPRAERYFFERLSQETSAGFDHVHLLKRADTHETLLMAGGLNCRVKPIGYRVSPQNLALSDETRRVLDRVRAKN